MSIYPLPGRPTEVLNLTEVGSIDKILAHVRVYGFAIFEGVKNEQELIALSEVFGEVLSTPRTNVQGVLSIEPNTKSEEAQDTAFTTRAMPLHTDSNAVEDAHELVLLWCKQAAPVGGDSIVCDGAKVYQTLASRNGDLLQKLLTPESVVFGHGLARFHVASVFSSEAEEVVSFRYRAQQDNTYYPLLTQEEVKELEECMHECSVTFPLLEGQGCILNNRRVAHGRSAFTGNRVLIRTLVRREGIYGKRILPGFIPKI